MARRADYGYYDTLSQNDNVKNKTSIDIKTLQSSDKNSDYKATRMQTTVTDTYVDSIVRSTHIH